MNFNRGLVVLFIISFAWNADPASAQSHPGFAPFTPSRIQWITLQADVNFKHVATSEEPYLLRITSTDSETLTILVLYDPILDQANENDFSPNGMRLQIEHNAMLSSIKAATAGIKNLAKAPGWTWLKVKEDVKNYKQAMDNP